MTEALQGQLIALCGTEHVRTLEGGAVEVLPANTSEVASVLRAVSAASQCVEVIGAGTKRGWGNTVAGSVKLRTTRMARVIEHTWQDMTCTVEAGCPWNALQSRLAEAGQFVALDPLWAADATVGGVVGANDSGALRLRYGSMRDLLIGVTVVLADGTIARGGGKVVKNVAGYDMQKLMTGAFGTLGVLTEVTLRLHALPRHTRTVALSCATPAEANEAMLRLTTSQLSLQAVQLRASAATGCVVDVQLAGEAEVLRAQQEWIAAHVNSSVADADSDAWSAREALFRRDGWVVKATMLPSRIAAAVEEVNAMRGASVTQAVGAMTAVLPDTALHELASMRARLEREGGSLTVLRAGAGSFDAWGALPSSFAVMQAVKREFDPHRLLNPGRMMGGL